MHHPQQGSPFFSLPAEIRRRIQIEYLKLSPEIKSTPKLLKGEEGTTTEWYKGVSIAHDLMLTCVKMYKEMRPLTFQDLTIRFPAEPQKTYPMKMVLPPPRERLQKVKLIVEGPDLRGYQGLASHLLEGPSLKEFTLQVNTNSRWHSDSADSWCFCEEIRASIKQRRARGQKVVDHPRGPSSPAWAMGPALTQFRSITLDPADEYRNPALVGRWDYDLTLTSWSRPGVLAPRGGDGSLESGPGHRNLAYPGGTCGFTFE
ncbi:hypothetical protein ACHAPT_005630 [Fusarium lateritium]